MAILSIELVTVWRGFDSLRGFGGQGRAIDGRNIYFLFSYFFPKHEWHLCLRKIQLETQGDLVHNQHPEGPVTAWTPA